MSRPGFNFFGHVTGHFGLGHSARTTLAWLVQEGQSVCVRDVVTVDGRGGPIPRFDAFLRRQPWGLPFDVNFFHLNPPEMLRHLALEWQLLPIERRLNVALPFWELPSVPPAWLELLMAMDLVLAPTRFVQSALLNNAPGMRCIHFPSIMDLPQSAPTDRGRFGLPEGALIFLSAFDVGSDIERKNPWAAIKAFQSAFAGQEAVRMVIKLTQPRGLSRVRAQLETLRRMVQADPRLILIDEHLPRPDLLTLFASCDVLVSLHRAEGLGMVLMEMMALGKPVVATAWSGNMDFTTSDNACLVDYDMVPVQAIDVVFQQERTRAAPRWAEARIPSAAVWMRRLFDEPNLCTRIGQQAAEDMRRRCASGRDGMLDKLKTALSSPEVRAGHETRAHWLYRQRVRGLARAFRTSPPDFVRRVGGVVRDAMLSREPDRQSSPSFPPRD